MRIGIDARSLLIKHPRGEGRSLRRLYQEISTLRPHWKLLFYGDDPSGNFSAGIDGAKEITFAAPAYRFNLWENLALPFRVWRDQIDILHCSSSSAPWTSPAPVIMTVHDVIPLVFNDGWPDHAVARFHKQLHYGLKKARAVICVSSHTKQDLLHLFDVNPDKVRVIHWGVDLPRNSDFTEVTTATILQRLGITNNYIMAFGGTARRKNTETLINAFTAASTALPGVQLVLVGLGKEGSRRKYAEIVARLGMSEHVLLLDYVTDAEVEALFCGALCLLYPSLYEGFGLPVLEAMSHGTPVIASNTTSIPEVAGEAAILINPVDVNAIASALVHVCSNPELRSQLAAKGRKRARQFNWQATAKATITAFEEAAGEGALLDCTHRKS